MNRLNECSVQRQAITIDCESVKHIPDNRAWISTSLSLSFSSTPLLFLTLSLLLSFPHLTKCSCHHSTRHVPMPTVSSYSMNVNPWIFRRGRSGWWSYHFQDETNFIVNISNITLKIDVLYQVFRLEHIKHSEVEPEKYFQLRFALLKIFRLILSKIR